MVPPSPDALRSIIEELASNAGLSMEAIRSDPTNAANIDAIYNSLMRKPNCDAVVSREVFDQILRDVVQNRDLLFEPRSFGCSDHYQLANFLTSRLRSKFMTFRKWTDHSAFLDDVEIVSFPSSQRYAYVFEHQGRHLIVIHYGLTQLMEFMSETLVLQKWIEELRSSDRRSAAWFPLIEHQVDDTFQYKVALGCYVQRRALLLPGVATSLPALYLLELIAEVALSELFVCAHEHVHITRGHLDVATPVEHHFHGLTSHRGPSLTDDQKLELTTDLGALDYFAPHGVDGST